MISTALEGKVLLTRELHRIWPFNDPSSIMKRAVASILLSRTNETCHLSLLADQLSKARLSRKQLGLSKAASRDIMSGPPFELVDRDTLRLNVGQLELLLQGRQQQMPSQMFHSNPKDALIQQHNQRQQNRQAAVAAASFTAYAISSATTAPHWLPTGTGLNERLLHALTESCLQQLHEQQLEQRVGKARYRSLLSKCHQQQQQQVLSSNMLPMLPAAAKRPLPLPHSISMQQNPEAKRSAKDGMS